MKLEWSLPFLVAASVAASPAFAADAKAPHSHAGDISAYEGTKTCAECHEEAVKDVAVSLHYQQLGEAPNLEGWPAGKKAGMLFNF